MVFFGHFVVFFLDSPVVFSKGLGTGVPFLEVWDLHRARAVVAPGISCRRCDSLCPDVSGGDGEDMWIDGPNRNRWFTVLNSMVDLSMANC